MNARQLAALASIALAMTAGLARADVTWLSHFSQVRWSGVIGVGGDAHSWNLVDSHGAAVPNTLFNGGTTHHEVNYNEDDATFGATWWGRAVTDLSSRAGYYQNGVAGFATRIHALTSTTNTTEGTGVLIDSHAQADYILQVAVTVPTAFRLRGAGDYEGVFNSLRIQRTSDGANAFWSFLSPDGHQVFDVTGVLDPGTWKLEVYHAVRVFGLGTQSKGTDITWVVGNVLGNGCNLADITEIGGTTEAPGAPDQQLTVDDIIVFINLFSDATGCTDAEVAVPCSRADVCGIGGPPEGPDGQLTVDDIIAFFNAFSDGC